MINHTSEEKEGRVDICRVCRLYSKQDYLEHLSSGHNYVGIALNLL